MQARLPAGELRHRITIEQPTQLQDPTSGAMTPGWTLFKTVRARIEPLSVRDFIAAKAQQSEISARITIRYQAGITAAMRIRHGDRIYNITGVLPDPKSGRKYLTLPCTEGVNDG